MPGLILGISTHRDVDPSMSQIRGDLFHLDAWNRSADQKHELAMLHAQAEVQSKPQDQRLEATIVDSGMEWVFQS